MRLLKALKIKDIQLRVMNTRVRKLRKTIKDIKQCADKADKDDNDMATHGDELTKNMEDEMDTDTSGSD